MGLSLAGSFLTVVRITLTLVGTQKVRTVMPSGCSRINRFRRPIAASTIGRYASRPICRAFGALDEHPPAVTRVGDAANVTGCLQPIEQAGHGSGGESCLLGQSPR